MHCAFQDRENLYLVMDYLEGGDLRYYINRRYNFTEDRFYVYAHLEFVAVAE